MNNPLHTDTIMGLRIIKARQIPRYVLPREVLPGIPWPEGFLDSFDTWANQHLGYLSLQPEGKMYMLGPNTLVMHPSDLIKLRRAK